MEGIVDQLTCTSAIPDEETQACDQGRKSQSGPFRKKSPSCPGLMARRYLEREITNHPQSGIEKSCVREIAGVCSEPIFHIVKTNIFPTVGAMRSYAQLQRQIHDALRVEHPEWVEPNGNCPTCDSYEARLAELLGLALPREDQPVAN